ncbi:MAG TPA: hypothetical protein DHV28_01085 [Ignavibacteriales bacterium]|nr:hypothetical protein [Ignavibacteriales bacterium]
MITKEQAIAIVRNLVPDIELRGMRISDQVSANKKLTKLPADCWYISYSHVPIQYLSCSNGSSIFICLSKQDGEVKFHQAI